MYLHNFIHRLDFGSWLKQFDMPLLDNHRFKCVVQLIVTLRFRRETGHLKNIVIADFRLISTGFVGKF